MSAIVCSNVDKAYGAVTVIRDFNLQIEEHEFVVFLGPSGCGKSTLLRMLAGLENISGGTVSIDGRVVNDLEPRERGVAMVFQNYALYPHMSIYENIAFGLRRQNIAESEIDSRVTAVSDTLGLQPYLQRKPNALSGGQQQRVAIARAMIKTPRVFLFDEPLSNLDAKLRNHMRVEIAKLHRSLRTTTVYVTHDQLEAMTLADRIVLMNQGKIAQIGTPSEIYRRPRNLFVAGFIGTPSMNFMEATVKKSATGWVLEMNGDNFAFASGRFSLKHGQLVVLGIRPTDLQAVKSGNAGGNSLSGVVDRAEFHGHDTLLTFSVNGKEIGAIVPASQTISHGGVVCFTWNDDCLHLFDRTSDESLLLDMTDAVDAQATAIDPAAAG